MIVELEREKINQCSDRKMSSSPISNEESKELSPLPAANKAATNFIDSIDLKTLGKTVFTDRLGTVSNAGKEIGEFTVSVEETTRGGEICYLVHAHSHGTIDNVACGTSVTAYIARGLVTLEQRQHEYMKIPHNPLDKKTMILKQGGQYFMKMVTNEGEKQQTKEKTLNSSDMKGFISEGANTILQRVMAIKASTPSEDAEFLSLDLNLNLCTTSYARLEDRKQPIDSQLVDVLGIERSLLTENGEMRWKSYFLSSGHMAWRSTLGSPVKMQLLRFPTMEEEEVPSPSSRRMRHRWEEDMEFWSRFLDRKEELRNAHTTYIAKHPELKALMTDFLQFLLLRKPSDVCAFASNYFDAFSSSPAESKDQR